MWYEVLPPAIIIVLAMAVPQFATGALNQAVFGNPWRRNQKDQYQMTMFLRDTRIDGAPWKLRGLENIPDK